MLSGKIFLVTGSTGRLGCEIVFRLEELGAGVLPVVLEGYPEKPKRVKWTAETNPIIIDCDNDLIDLPVPDYVINLHWRVNRELSFTEQLLYETDYNVCRPHFLWNWIKYQQLTRFVNISSVKVFSNLNKSPISANVEPRPVDPYGISKFAAEKFFDAYFNRSPFNVTHLRLCSVASIGEHPSQLMSQLAVCAIENKRIRINAGHTSNILFIDDAVDLIINATLTAKQNFYNLTSAARENEKIALKFECATGHTLNADYFDFTPDLPDPVFISDIPKIDADWTRKTSIEEMIKKFMSSQRL
jgi:nucleoside-diphosphate-sugar epimerase